MIIKEKKINQHNRFNAWHTAINGVYLMPKHHHVMIAVLIRMNLNHLWTETRIYSPKMIEIDDIMVE